MALGGALTLAGAFIASANHCFDLAATLQFLMSLCTIGALAVRLHAGEAATSPLLPALPALPTLPKGARVAVFGALALGVFFLLPFALRLIDPTAGGFAPDTINAAALGAFQFFAALSMAYASWRWLFPDLYRYAMDCMEGKLLENLTDDLKALLGPTRSVSLLEATEYRHIAQFQFLIRCTRFVLSLSPFLLFLLLANHALTAALTAVPGGAPV
ncbi:hypothetical protein EAH73_01695 [Hymenobacter nivis]|uniref:Uncharacterized protein n=2 Tax=Hymenobacter nivis TaxID=1850093 RepID=A0A502HET3_9BACT|nr:hypothetical protein EAH73_01695 [Hymenobacter nivis]